MKDTKKSKRKRSDSSSESSSESRHLSSRSSSPRRYKRSHKHKKSKDHRRYRSRSIDRQRSKLEDKTKDKNRENNNSKQYENKSWDNKRQQDMYKQQEIKKSERVNQEVKIQKQLPCFQPSGILLQYYNAREGVSLRFHQPPQSREPDQQWRMYIFKGQQVLQPIMLTKSCYLIGKDERVADILTENPSISRQHAVIQFRLVQKRQTEGQFVEQIKPYVMDLQSTNGTVLNDQKIQPGRYYELLHRDVLKFGFSGREYVLVKWEQNQSEAQQQ